MRIVRSLWRLVEIEIFTFLREYVVTGVYLA